MENNIDKKIKNATKWTLLAECLSKVVTPVTGIILARVLAPEAFGIIASILVVVSFAEMFADAGFQKYFVQHDFAKQEEKETAFITALMTCCIVACLIWLLICIFSEELSSLLGNAELKNGLCVASIGILFNSFSGMQSAIFKREFNFKLLFRLRIVTLTVPVVITIPLALLGFGYWALIIGMLSQQIFACIFQGLHANIPMRFIFDFIALKRMLSFSLWTLFESITIWLSTWGQIFLIGNLLNSYYVGLFRGGTSLTAAMFSIVSNSIMPVLFSALSAMQNDKSAFQKTFYQMQKICILCMAPLGMMIFVFRDVIVDLFLGQQWQEVALLVGLNGLVEIFSITINSMASEALRAKGMPKVSSVSQLLFFPLVFWVIYETHSMGFYYLVLGISVCRLELYFVKIILLKKYLGFRIVDMVCNIIPVFFAACASACIAIVIKNALLGIVGILLAAISFGSSYIFFISINKENRVWLTGLYRKIKNKLCR